MIRVGRTSLAVIGLLVLPAIASAQKDTRQTREAEKYIGLAMMRPAGAERAGMYAQAMEHLRPAMTEDASNPKVWRLAGTALAAMGELHEADAAFDRAVELHPAYLDEVNLEREQAWVDAFNRGIQFMEAQQNDSAIAAMEAAQVIYAERPEALLNLGALYSHLQNYDKAVESLKMAADATDGPLFHTLDAEQQAEWTRYRLLSMSNIAQINAQRGIDAFNIEDFAAAAAYFLSAADANPYARDYWFNYGQALWAQTAPLEQSLTTAASRADSTAIEAQLTALYEKIRETAQKAREFDPNNETLYLMEARTHRMAGEFAGGAKRQEGQQAALRLLQAQDALPVSLDQVIVQNADTSATITGTVKTGKAAPGSTVTIQFTLLGADGATVGEHTVTVTAAAAGETATFEAVAPVTGDVAGWKYVVAS